MSQRVLLVEDSLELLNYIAEVVSSAGFEVSCATDGEEAVSALQRNRCDLVILDLFMPKKDGFQTLAEIAKLRPRPRTLAISGGGRFSLRDTLLLASRVGADSTLSKPFTGQELLDAVRQLAAASEGKVQHA